MRRNIGFIFQMHNLFDSLTAFENVKMAMQLGGCPHAEMRRRGTEILERLGLGHRIDHKPKALSGGQRQRVAVARALVNRPEADPRRRADRRPRQGFQPGRGRLAQGADHTGGLHRRHGHP